MTKQVSRTRWSSLPVGSERTVRGITSGRLVAISRVDIPNLEPDRLKVNLVALVNRAQVQFLN